jgi:hypothetical protein
LDHLKAIIVERERSVVLNLDPTCLRLLMSCSFSIAVPFLGPPRRLRSHVLLCMSPSKCQAYATARGDHFWDHQSWTELMLIQADTLGTQSPGTASTRILLKLAQGKFKLNHDRLTSNPTASGCSWSRSVSLAIPILGSPGHLSSHSACYWNYYAFFCKVNSQF